MSNSFNLPIRFIQTIETCYLAHFLNLISPEHLPDFYRTTGEFILHVKLIGHRPGTGGDGPGPEYTQVELEIDYPSALYFLGYYWGQRELRLKQLQGKPDPMLIRWHEQRQPHLSTAATYAQLVDSLTSYGGTNNATMHDYQVPADGIFRVSREHYDPDATPDEDVLYSGDGDNQTNNVRIDVAFAVDWQRLKLLLADTEYDLEPAEPRWLDTETWVIMGDGFEESLCLCRFTEKHYPKEEVGVCFLAEWE